MGNEWIPSFSPWRHGGWYVDNVRYPGGACGCVSNNYPDKKWRIVCREGQEDIAFSTRADAAKAEKILAEERSRHVSDTEQRVTDAATVAGIRAEGGAAVNLQDVIAELARLHEKAEDESDRDESGPGITEYGEARCQEGRAAAFEEAINLVKGAS